MTEDNSMSRDLARALSLPKGADVSQFYGGMMREVTVGVVIFG